jgi:hypothetical protein
VEILLEYQLEASFNELNKIGHSHRPFEMSVELVDDKSNLKFQLHLSACSRWEYRTHAKGHYEIECIDSGENFPRIQRCIARND